MGLLQLPVDASVGFPGILIEAALRYAMFESPPIMPGVQLRWAWGTFDHPVTPLPRPGDGNDAGPCRLDLV